jgi:hypothetical protein
VAFKGLGRALNSIQKAMPLPREVAGAETAPWAAEPHPKALDQAARQARIYPKQILFKQ